jgi:hypothetical protein
MKMRDLMAATLVLASTACSSSSQLQPTLFSNTSAVQRIVAKSSDNVVASLQTLRRDS